MRLRIVVRSFGETRDVSINEEKERFPPRETATTERQLQLMNDTILHNSPLINIVYSQSSIVSPYPTSTKQPCPPHSHHYCPPHSPLTNRHHHHFLPLPCAMPTRVDGLILVRSQFLQRNFVVMNQLRRCCCRRWLLKPTHWSCRPT